ncbi:MAG: prolyl oligopeptidase family serine peptidase [Acidimicrobiales bacterium]|nr:prolyl oligopeptidase family serine peptidase [Acidimicrobiales bacterium]
MAVPDPYRWLEAADAEVTSWVAAQNGHTRAVLDALPGREALHDDLARLLRVGSSVAPHVAGNRLFTLERWGHHDQTVLVVRPASSAGRARTLIDPARLSDDPTAAIDWYHPSPDGSRVAYGLSTGGDERSTLAVLDVASGHHLPDRIPHTRAASMAWEPDGAGFFYTRYPDPDAVGPGEAEYGRHVRYHRLGSPTPLDPVVWDDLPDPAAWTTVDLSRDGRWLLFHVSVGWQRTDVHLVDRRSTARTVLIEGVEARSALQVVDDQVIGVTTLDADRGRIVAAPLTSAWHDHWCTVVPESDAVIEALAVTPSSLLVLSTRSAVSLLHRHAHDGTGTVPVALPEVGSASALTASPDRDEAFLALTSFTTPPTTYRWSAETDDLVDWSRLHGEHDPDGPQGRYVAETRRYPSTDGTEVTMFLVRATATEPGPNTPCVLTGYGGFSVTLGPAYSAAVVDVCDRGGLYAVAGIRGGAEEGEAWHRAGMGADKVQSFDDFAAAADWLVEKGLTGRDRLAVRGGSNGGLLMGAMLTRRPDLCAAVHAAVPLMDMVRYPEFLIGRLWVPEYGDPDRGDEFAWLWSYSPYHRVVDGTCYPATLITSAAGDSRVHPAHARKMAARLQAATSCGTDRPILLREEADAGHGQGKPVAAQADELTDVLGFLYDRLGVAVAEGEAAGSAARPG